ncbi:MAG: helix-turn-helix domain-containing protein [Actinomycetota bacterium]
MRDEAKVPSGQPDGRNRSIADSGGGDDVDAPITEVTYRPSAAGLPFEALRLADLEARLGRRHLERLEQLRFDLVVIVTAGVGRHEVDFTPTTISPERVLHVRPGQVHRWVLDPPYEAVLLLFAPTPGRTEWAPGPSIIELTEAQRHDLAPVLDLAVRPRRSGPRTPVAAEGLRLLTIDALGLDRRRHPDVEPLHAELLAALDADGYRNRSVAHHAARLGCSVRTLARACVRATGGGPKQVIDEATALAAQRRLRLEGVTVGEVAQSLAFDEVTNFTKFFRRLTGETPSGWQRSAVPV